MGWFANLWERFKMRWRRRSNPFAGLLLPEPDPLAQPGLEHDKARVVRSEGDLLVRPAGFQHVTVDPEMEGYEEMQMAAVNYIFSRLELEWIPGEFFDILAEHPEPIDAFERFCRFLGLNPNQIGASGSMLERERLHERVGILLDLSALREVMPPAVHRYVADLLRAGQYSQVAAITERLRHFYNVLHDARDQDEIQFPLFRQFLGQLEDVKDNPLGLTEDEVEEAREAIFWFKTTWEQAVDLSTRADGMLMWIQANWPDNKWGKDNAPVANGLATRKGQLDALLLGTDIDGSEVVLDIEGIEEALVQLETVCGHIEVFISHVQANFGGADYSDPARKDAIRDAGRAACDHLGIAAASLSEGTLKKAYRKLAFKYHPDKWAGKPQEQEMTERFQELERQRAILEEVLKFGVDLS